VRQLDKGQQLELLLAIIKNISQLDVIANAYLLDVKEETLQQKELELQTQSFINNVFNGFLPLLMELTFAPINHILSLLLERADVVQLVLSRVGTLSKFYRGS
jgi:DNA topoisomerase 2-associated protein PAT1